MSVKVALVLRSGGEYTLEHVHRLVQQIRTTGNWTGEIVVLSDLPVEIPGVFWAPMQFGYPSWWSKMELFTLGGDLLYLDLDSTVVGDINDLARINAFAPNADFYKPEKLQTSIAFFTAEGCERMWIEWLRLTPPYVMANWRGDGEFLNYVWKGGCVPLQALVPGQVVSYKIDVQLDAKKSKHTGNGFIPSNARVVCHHGTPRPWQVPAPRFQ